MPVEYEWREVAHWSYNSPDWRFWNIGLSPTGRYCFIVWWDRSPTMLFDVKLRQMIWSSETDEAFQESVKIEYGHNPAEDDWQGIDWIEWLETKEDQTHLELDIASVQGSFRLIGLANNSARLTDEKSNLKLSIIVETSEIQIHTLDTDEPIQRLKYRTFSQDWAYTTFSDDGTVIAVIEPLYITFFRRFPKSKG